MVKIIRFLVPVLLGAIIGLIGGLLSYAASFVMSWLNDTQQQMIIPLFLVGGIFCGLYVSIANLKRNKK